MMTDQRLPDALSRVREARRRISAEFGDDPKRLVEYYMKCQQEYPGRLVHTTTERGEHTPDR